MKQKLLGREVFLEAVKQTAPAQIIRQVLGGDAVKACHPGLQTGVVAVDTLHVPDAIAPFAMVGRDEGTGFHVQFLGNGPVGRVAIGAEHRADAQHRPQRFGQRERGATGKHLVKFDLGSALHGHHHRGGMRTNT